MKQRCTDNSKFWLFLYKLQKLNGNKPLLLTDSERFNLCNYMNGLPYDRKVLKRFIVK
jgi:hypothetical protein